MCDVFPEITKQIRFPHFSGKPRVEIKDVPDYLAEGENLEITCLAVGYPKANVTLQFQECSSGIDSCNSSLYVNEVKVGSFVLVPIFVSAFSHLSSVMLNVPAYRSLSPRQLIFPFRHAEK